MSIENPQEPRLGEKIRRRAASVEKKVVEKFYDASKESILAILATEAIGTLFVVFSKHIENVVVQDVTKDLGLGIGLVAAAVGVTKAYRFISGNPDPDDKLFY